MAPPQGVSATPTTAAAGTATSGRRRRLPRDLHPVAWWVWALGLAAAATRTTNPWLLILIVLVASVTVLSRRTDAPWALSFRLYLALGRGRGRPAGVLPGAVRQRLRRDRAAGPARGAAAGVGGRHHPAGPGHPGVAARRRLRRHAAGDGHHLRGRGQLPGRPAQAAGVAAGRALRGGHRRGHRLLAVPPAGRERPAGTSSPSPPRGGRPWCPGAAADRRAGARGRPGPLGGAGRQHGRPRLRTHRARGPGADAG